MVDYFNNGKSFPFIFGFLFFCIIFFFYLKEKIIQCTRKKYDCTREQSFVILSRSEGKSSRFLVNLFFFARMAATSSYILMVVFVIFSAIYWHFRISDLTASWTTHRGLLPNYHLPSLYICLNTVGDINVIALMSCSMTCNTGPSPPCCFCINFYIIEYPRHYMASHAFLAEKVV